MTMFWLGFAAAWASSALTIAGFLVWEYAMRQFQEMRFYHSFRRGLDEPDVLDEIRHWEGQ